MKTIVQVCDLSGHTLSIQKIDKAIFTIGRGWGCDIIVNEPHVCPVHAEITVKPGSWQVLDAGSMNGIFYEGKGVEIIDSLQSSEHIRIGNRILTFFEPDHKVAPTKPLYQGVLPFQNWGNLSTGVCTGLILLLVFVLLGYQELASEIKWKKLLSENFLALLLPFLWAVVWAFIGKISTHQVRFFFHFSTSALILAGLSLLDAFGEYLEFIFSSSLFSTIWGYLNVGFFLALAIYISQGIATYLSVARRIAIATIITSLSLVFAFIVGFSTAPDFVKSAQYSYILKPISSDLLPSVTLKQHLRRNEKLFQSSVNDND